jgi:hypothetical protein
MILKGGCPAIHKTGNIGRSKDEYIRVLREEDDYYIGFFEEGLGFYDVKFKKTDCRPLIPYEVEKVNNAWFTINSTPLCKMHVDTDGNIIRNK